MNPGIKRVIGLALQDVEGGVIERDNGEPTGVLREKALELLKPLTDHEETASHGQHLDFQCGNLAITSVDDDVQHSLT